MKTTLLCAFLFFQSLFLQVHSASLSSPFVSLSKFSGTSSFDIKFQEPVQNLPADRIKVTDENGNYVALGGSVTLTPSKDFKTWTVTNPSGFSSIKNISAQFTNAPQNSICKPPVSPFSGTPTTVVGTGTPGSCTEDAFSAAVAKSGYITFNCGPKPVTLTLSKVINVPLGSDTIIDGGGLVTLSGGGKTRILAIQTTSDKQTPRLTVQNLAFTQGHTTDSKNTKNTDQGGGAMYRMGGAFTIINCDFYDNQGPETGQDVAGGAVYSVGGADTTIVSSLFSNNKCSNGGAIGNLGNDFSIYNSVVNANQATGTGANPGNGGNGGGISFDGEGVNTIICGTTISYNSAGAFGAICRVGYTYDDSITIQNSTFAYNTAVQGAGIYVQALTVVIKNTTVMFNSASGGAGIALQYQAHYTLSGVTVANNSATTSLGGGIYINDGQGTISDTTIVGNTANHPDSFASGISGGDTQTTLTRSIVAYGSEGNKYNPLSCQNTLNEGGNNFQFPEKRGDGSVDTKCSGSVTFADPQVADVADNGCVTWTAKPLSGSPATRSGSSNCAIGNYPSPVVTYEDGKVIPRGPYYSSSSSKLLFPLFSALSLFCVLLL